MTLRVCAKVLFHVWSYDFYDTTLSTNQFVDIHLQGSVIVDFGTVQVNEEENVRPHVVFMTDMVFKALKEIFYTVNSRYLKVEVHFKLLISQNKFLVPNIYFEIP